MRDGKRKRLAGGKGGHKFWGGKDIERVEGAGEAPNGPLEVPFSRRALLAGAFTIPPAMKKSMEDWGIEMPSALAVRQTRAWYGSPKYDPNGFFRTPGWVFDAGDETRTGRQECYHLIGSPGPDKMVEILVGTKIQRTGARYIHYTTNKLFYDAGQGGALVHRWVFTAQMRRKYYDRGWHPEQSSFRLPSGHHEISIREEGSHMVDAFWRFSLDVPFYCRCSIRVVSGARGYKSYPVRNGRYNIRSAADRNMGLSVSGTGNPDISTVLCQNISMWEAGVKELQWFVASEDGVRYAIAPIANLAATINDDHRRVPGNAFTYPRIQGDPAGFDVLTRLPNGNCTIRCSANNGYLTAEGTSFGANVSFQPRRAGDPKQEWIFEQVDERMYTDAELNAARRFVEAPLFAFNAPSYFSGSFDAWHQDVDGVVYDTEADGLAYNLMRADISTSIRQTRASNNHLMMDNGGNPVFKVYPNIDGTITIVNQPKGGKIPVHFMLVDENGNVTEVYTGGAQAGAWLSTGDAMFGAARDKIAQRYEPGVADYADKWYRGEQWFDPGMFGHGKFTGETANKPIYLWAQILVGDIKFYADGCNDGSVVYRTGKKPLGTTIYFAGEIDSKGIRPRCNLNSNFGSENSNGFTGWSLNPGLRDRISSLQIKESKTYRIYGRNRATLRIARASNSVMPDPAGDYRVAPDDGAARYDNPLGIPDISTEKAHVVQGPDGRDLTLPAIHDDGADHECGYVGEVMRLPVPRTVYERMGDGRWKTYRAECWISSPDGQGGIAPVSETGGDGRNRRASGAPVSSVTMREDTVRYIRWVETVVDGVETRA